MGKITTYHKGDMLFESKIGNHSIVIDVPDSMGGSDRGATPPQIFIASLGSCIGAFVANYCNNVGIDTTDLNVDVSFEKVEDPTRLTNVKVQVNVPNGDISGREKALLRVAGHCPVHETICTLEDVDIAFSGKE
jgi:putative redox protein